MDTIEDDMKR